MNVRVRRRRSAVRVASGVLFAAAIATALAACAANSDTGDNGGLSAVGDEVRPPAIAFVDRPDGRPTIEVVAPLDGSEVSTPTQITVQASGLLLAAPGSPVDGRGHWHVLFDGCLPAGALVPDTSRSIHVGSGRPTAVIDLPPGTHELCVQISDGFHVAVNVHDTVIVTVVDE